MNIGLIGYGFMGGAHAAAIQSLPDATLYALACRTRPTADGPRRGNLDLKTTPLPESVKWTPDWQEIVADPAVDAVDICLPTNLHRDVVLSALAHGKHVLCEKPMGMNPAECDELMAAAAKAGKTFMVAQVLRFMYPYTFALDFIRKVGAENVTACSLQRSTGYPQWSDWLAKTERSGGAILDLLSHDLDQALLWFGQPAAVAAVSLGEVDTAEVTLRYGDRVVTVNGGWLVSDTKFSCSFHVATADRLLAYDGKELTLTENGKAETIAIPEHDPYVDEIAYFVDCVKTGAAPDRCPPADSARVVQLVEVVKRSREEQGRETVWQ
jgi:predicted dehydrogenase